MADLYNMGGHKLYWHPDRINDWMKGKKIAPLHIDAGLSKGCNIRCEYCYGAIQGNLYKEGSTKYFPRDALLSYMRSAGEVGVRSIGLIGEAEPLLNPNVYDAIVEGTKAGVDIALATNGTLFDNGEKGITALKNLVWLRFNLSAASDEAYQKIHGSPLFFNVIKNIKFCVKTKKELNLPVTIGIQMVLTPNNVKEVVSLAKLGKELGVDYFVVKQCSDTQDSKLGFYNQLGKYKDFTTILKEAEDVTTDNYNVIIKWPHIKNEGKRNYDQCLGTPFLLYTSGDGKVYPCGMFFNIHEEEFRMGDLTKQTFKEIIESDRYWEVVEKVKKLDVHSFCYANCRTHSINDFLWKIKNPPPHVNFV
ncbi:MAG: radical SAM protein [Nanoarchaeota archaeon]